MAKYLDPKADVTFKKVFGEHKNLVMSLLNALLPLEDGKQVESIEYLSSELVPRTPTSKNTIVDVRCEETGERKFIVEMQMNWTADFRQRVPFFLTPPKPMRASLSCQRSTICSSLSMRSISSIRTSNRTRTTTTTTTGWSTLRTVAIFLRGCTSFSSSCRSSRRRTSSRRRCKFCGFAS